MNLCPPRSTLFPYTTLFRSNQTDLVNSHCKPLGRQMVGLGGWLQAVHSVGREPLFKELAQSGVGKLGLGHLRDRKSTRLNSSHGYISYAVFCLKKKKKKITY